MHRIKTLACLIDENTYPIAVACLPGGFATIPFAKVDGCYLVLNEMTAITRGTDTSPVAALTNGWLKPYEFDSRWRVLKKDSDLLPLLPFYEVERI